MNALKAVVEWYLGIPPADPGQGTAWTYSHKTPWPSGMPDWAVLLCGLGLLAFIIWVYIRDASRCRWPARVGLMGLRLLAVVLIGVMLTELTLSVDRTGLPFIAVMIDQSASMSLEDQYEGDIETAIKELIAKQATQDRSRLGIAKTLLTRDDGEFLKRLVERHKIRIYQFSETAAPAGNNEYIRSEEIPELLPLIKKIQAAGPQTRPNPSVQKVLSDFRGTPPSAIIVISDGITSTNDADKLSIAAQAARRDAVPIYTVAIGSEEPARDINLYDTVVDEVAFVDDPITFTAKLKGFGFKKRSIDVALKDKKTDRVLNRTTVDVNGNGQSQPVEVTFVAEDAGEYEFVLEAAPLTREANVVNNVNTRHVSVREGRIRVLLIDSAPRWEYRELKNLLEREQTVELHTVLQDADPAYSRQDRSAQALDGRFPVKRDQLFAYDVILFGDVDPKYLSSGVMENLRDFVREAGGGLMMIAGPNYNPGEYHGMVLETLLPIELAGARIPSPDVPILDAFHPELTIQGQKGSMIFRFAETETASQQVWNTLPGMYWMVEAPKRKPGTVVFAQHPLRSGSDGKFPVIVMLRYGAGKVVFHATDELWRWRFRSGDLYYGRYWIQAIRYLSRTRLLGKSKNLDFDSDRDEYDQDDTVHLRVRFLNEQHMPDEDNGVQVVIEREGGGREELELRRLPQVPTVFEGQIRRAREGTYHAWVAQPSFKEAPQSIDYRVEPPRRETSNRSLDRAELTAAAKITRGKAYTLATVGQLPDDIPPGEPIPIESEDPIPLWNRWEVLLLFAGVLTIEWLVRKKLRMV